MLTLFHLADDRGGGGVFWRAAGRREGEKIGRPYIH
ncbi:hypothetical protein GWI33_009016, partial [Rhynchophorus ferrugineus]